MRDSNLLLILLLRKYKSYLPHLIHHAGGERGKLLLLAVAQRAREEKGDYCSTTIM